MIIDSNNTKREKFPEERHAWKSKTGSHQQTGIFHVWLKINMDSTFRSTEGEHGLEEFSNEEYAIFLCFHFAKIDLPPFFNNST